MNNNINNCGCLPFASRGLPTVFSSEIDYYTIASKTYEKAENAENIANNSINTSNNTKEYVDNYFENLDINTEINNKLNDLVSDGTITSLLIPLISSYAGILTVNSVSEMTDKSKLYLLVTNGNIYAWNGSAFYDTEIHVGDVSDVFQGGNVVTDNSTYNSFGDLPADRYICVNPPALKNFTDVPDGWNTSTNAYELYFTLSNIKNSAGLQLIYNNSGQFAFRSRTTVQWLPWNFIDKINGVFNGGNVVTDNSTYNSFGDLPADRYICVNPPALKNFTDVPDGWNTSTNAYELYFTLSNIKNSAGLQLIYNNSGQFAFRSRTSVQWLPWRTSDVYISSGGLINNTSTYNSLDDLPLNKLYLITTNDIENTPFIDGIYNVLTMCYSTTSVLGRLQIAYNFSGGIAYRTSTSVSYGRWFYVGDYTDTFNINPFITASGYQSIIYNNSISTDKKINCNIGTNYNGDFVDISNATGTGRITLTDNNNNFIFKNINIIKRNNNNVNKKLLIIGDSITALGGYITQINQNAINDGNTITFLGTLNYNGIKHEGRGGWSIQDYYNKQYVNNKLNPFYNTVNKVFDFNYYLSVSQQEAPDMVLLALGTNDTNNTTSFNELYKTTFYDYNYIINDIKQYVNTVCVWAVPPCAVNHYNFLMAQRKVNIFNALLNKKVDADVCYNSIAVDGVSGYNNITVNRSKYTDDTILYSSEIHHFNECGMKQLGDNVYNFIVYKMQLM